jgi:hypothetical protein
MKHQISVRVYVGSRSTRRAVRKLSLFSNKKVSVGSVLRILRLDAYELVRLKLEKASDRKLVDLCPDDIIQGLDVPVRDSRFELNLYI